MKGKRSRRFTWKEHIALLVRGYKVFSKFPKPLLLSKTAACLFNVGAPFVNIYFSAAIINELTGPRNIRTLTLLVVLTVGINLAVMLMKSLVGRWAAYCDSCTWNSINEIYTDKLLSLDYGDAEDPKIQQEITEIRQHQNGMAFGLIKLPVKFDGIVSGAIQIILSVALALSLFTTHVPEGSPYAFLDSPAAIMLFTAVLCCSIFLVPYLSMIGERVWEKASENNNIGNRLFGFYFLNMINGSEKAKDIRIYDQKKLISRNSSWDGIVASMNQYMKYDGAYKSASTAVSYLAYGLMYLFVALKAYSGAFGVGSIVLYVGAISQFGNGFAAVLNHVGTLLNNNVFLDRIFRFLDIPNKKYQGALSVDKREGNEYEIEFRNVSFKYPGSEGYALKNFSMKLNVGRKIAVVGINGSGKTTMIKLLCRLYDPDEGMITLNGIDIKKYNYKEYTALFSVVFQDFRLLPFTLGENVAASMAVEEGKAEDCLRKAGFGERLHTLPDKLQTFLYNTFEEDGVEISGGEAQKIALARALYKDAPFIVLDEPTAALDPIAEYDIYTKFNEIVSDKTAVYISHRLSSCRFCDDILVFHEGKLIQRGNHEELITDENGKYYELWNAQAQYYNETAVV